MPGSGANYAFTCLLFLLGGISHIKPHKMSYIIYNRDANERDHPQNRPRIAAVTRADSFGLDQARLLAEAQGRCCDAAATRNLADGKQE